MDKNDGVQDSYPLSPVQQAMLFHGMSARGAGTYVQHAICDLREDLDASLLARAWTTVIERHTVLRTAFRVGELRDPLQEVHRHVELTCTRHDWTALPPSEQAARFDAYLEADRRRDFDPERAPLMRLAHFRLASEHSRLLWTYHHALLDGRGVRIVLRELFDLYDAYRDGREFRLPPPHPFRDFIDWLHARDAAAAGRYWQQALAGLAPAAPLPGRRAERSRTGAQEGYAAQETRLTGRSTDALRLFARRQGLTLNTLVLGAWAQLLSRYNGELDVCFGATLALRGAGPAAFKETVGLLINTVPMRVNLPPEMALLPWLQALRGQWLAMRAHAWAPMTTIRNWGGVPHGGTLFSSLVVFEHTLLDAALKEDRPGWTTRQFSRKSGAGHPLTVVAFGEPELSLKIVYERSLFEPAMVGSMLGHLRTLLEGATLDPHAPLSAQRMLTEPEERRLLIEWNDTGRKFPVEDCVHRLFEQQVARAPDAVAIDSADCALTYREVNERSNRLAGFLRRAGVGTDTLVGICMERSPEVIVAMLGILKAGGAYLPLDAGGPPERLRYLLQDAGLLTVIATDASAPRIGAFAGRVILVDGHHERIALESPDDRSAAAGMDDLAYAVYTSGSTGQPKGILVSHRALANHTLALVEKYAICAADRRLQFVSIGSDVLVAEVFPVLLAGGTVVLRPNVGVLSIGDFMRFLEDRRITITGLPSAYWHEWVAALSGENARFPSSLRIVISGMDLVRPDLFALWKPMARGHVRWFNAYGPSETTCTAAVYEADLENDETLATVPIGRPLANVRIYVLDANARPVPIGIPGEIVIGGLGVARGYLNRPALTSLAFVRDPFSDDRGARLYRTGDVGRYRPDGNIEFLGRIDDQIKIRGFRVELGEVEAALRELPAVREAAVIVRGETADARQLIAYVVPDGGVRPAPGELRSLLQRTLPDYMLPAAFVFLDALPLTLSGKIDQGALPEPGHDAGQAKGRDARPADPLECALTAIWEALLQVPVRAGDKFFELGGDSLRGIRLLDQVHTVFDVRLPLEALFDEAATVSAMAARINAERVASA